jgi:serine/threonine-protein kinase
MSDFPEAAVPARVGRYELLIPIATGGMGTVYLGRTEVMPGVMRDVAVKLMHKQLGAEAGIASELMHEARLAVRIRHPNVVAVLEAGETPDGVYLAMDHVEGDSLAVILRAARERDEIPPLPVVGRILYDALSGLHAAHELKDESGRSLHLVHRDVSPQNILVGSDGISRLTDFGIAKAFGHSPGTATGIVKGKVGYMAPEHARGERVDGRSDVWSAGVVAWEALTTRRLFKGKHDAATLLQVISGQRPPPPSRARPAVSRALDEAILAALEAKPSRRVATAQAFRDRLEEAFTEHGGIARHEQVAAYVMELVGDRIAQRHERARNVLSLREKIASVSAEAVAQAHSDAQSSTGTPLSTPPSSTGPSSTGPSSAGPSSPPSIPHPPADFRDAITQSALSAPTLRRSSGRRWLFTAAVLVIAAGTAFALKYGADENPAHVEAASVPTPTASTETPPKARVLYIEANAPIAQLELDARTIVVPEASRRIEVPIGDRWPERVSAISSDGRKLELPVPPGAERVQVDFPPPGSSPPGKRAQPVQRGKRRGDSGPGLADSPYGAP